MSSLEAYVGKMLNVKVIECVPEDGRVVFSERAALAEPGKRAELFHELQTGSHVKGIVTNITDFGVFVDLGGVEGLDPYFRTVVGTCLASESNCQAG